MPLITRDHISIEGRTETFPYTSNQTGRKKVVPRIDLDRAAHGARIRAEFEEAIQNFSEGEEFNFVYLVFKSPIDLYMDIEALGKSNCRLTSYKRVDYIDENQLPHWYFEATVQVNRRAISIFLNKIEAYLNEDTRINYNQDGSYKSGGNPKHQPLVANIDEIRAATLESFWQEPSIEFPATGTQVWWEVWIDREGESTVEAVKAELKEMVEATEILVNDKHLQFPEHYIFLLRGSVEQLAATILYSDKLCELRKPKDTAAFFTYLEKQEQQEWIDDLNARCTVLQNPTVSVCILDTGVTLANPLLNGVISAANLGAVNPLWTNADTYPDAHGHGTPMAGLVVYGDLVEALASEGNIEILHQVESIKLIETSQPHPPEIYGAVTQEAIYRAELLNPENNRVVCLAITSEDGIGTGRPSSWSSAIDQILFGSVDEPNDKTIVCISAGNIQEDQWINYPIINDDFSIHDPAQSFNALTVGAYTLRYEIDQATFPNSTPLANIGGMSPCNSTSFSWLNEWPKKPDIVMEGGNAGIQDGGTISPDSLRSLSTSRGALGRPWLTVFGDTSGATALASKFAAELYHYYPTYWPETVRGLVVHSASWTNEMLANKPFHTLTQAQKAKLLSHVGYGTPNFSKARYTASNSVSLIAERTLKPFRLVGSKVKTHEFHLFDLPWPVEALHELHATEVKLTVTLSYYVEPNPGNKDYEAAASYRSHGLRFKVIGRNESLQRFKARISREMREEDYEREGEENWLIGSKLRDKGSVHKDIWVGTAAELAERNKIAIYPTGGWWKSRKKRERYNNDVRYSLIVSIETPSEEHDILTPVLASIGIDL